MVRAETNELQSDEKKETTSKKRASQKKKDAITGIWPCKINGCNKQFAREADLKRHQRTTKLHSMPSFSCPQCDATFTRTDAQRRHQKSRHNGVIIESSDQVKTDESVESHSPSGSGSRSRSGTPSRKGKENPNSVYLYTQQGTPITTGPSSYYRQHTATISPYVPPRPIAYYPQVGHPTSSARNTSPNWSFPHQWPPQPAAPYNTPQTSNPHYTPSPHYRTSTVTNGNGYHYPPPPLTSDNSGSTRSSSQNDSPVSRESSTQHPSDSNGFSNGHIPVTIDHTLSSDGSVQLTDEEVEAAMQAVIKYAEVDTASKKAFAAAVSREGERSFNGCEDSRSTSSINDQDGRINSPLDEMLHDYGTLLGRPEPMEHMLTEDGEPMLNPAELLTQESLASPPPS